MKTIQVSANRSIVAMAIIALSAAVQAVPVTIDFGTSWPALGDPLYNDPLSPYSRLMGYEGGKHSNETCIAGFVNEILSCSTFSAPDICKTEYPVELGGSDGYFMVPSGWNYLVVQYDGPCGGSVLLRLGGNAAKVPFDSSMIWGSSDKYAVSHYSVTDPAGVPDGGTTLSLIGIALGGLAAGRRLLKR